MSLHLLILFLILCQICTSINYEVTKPKYRYFSRIKPGNVLVKSRKSKEDNNCDSNPVQRRFMYNFVGEPSGKQKQPKPKPNSDIRKSKEPDTGDYNEQYPIW